MPNVTRGGMGKCTKQLHDLSQTFIDIRTLKVMNMCLIYLTASKKYDQKYGSGTGSKRQRAQFEPLLIVSSLI